MTKKLHNLLDQLMKLHPKYIDLSLNRLILLLDKLDNPHLKLPPVIHIAGTNGKGSTLSFIKKILEENNYLVHCYFSPHLESIEERFIIANKKIKKRKLFDILNYVKKINGKNPITFFEVCTAVAFYLFSKKKGDFVLLETGLGGRLDATNVIKEPLLNIISPISFDHQEFLGKSLKKITNEKLGIIKAKSTIIFSKQKTFVKKYIKEKIKKIKNKKIFYGQEYKILNQRKNFFSLKYKNKIYNFNKPSLLGDHQIENSSAAIVSILQLKEQGYKITKSSINRAISKTYWPGRLEKGYLKNIPVYLDGAHNVAGAEKLNSFFLKRNCNRWLILGMLNNKDLKNYLLKIKNSITGVIAIRIPEEKNSFFSSKIYKVCKKLDIVCIEKKNIADANKYILDVLKPKEILISGSLYLVGKIRRLYI